MQTQIVGFCDKIFLYVITIVCEGIIFDIFWLFFDFFMIFMFFIFFYIYLFYEENMLFTIRCNFISL